MQLLMTDIYPNYFNKTRVKPEDQEIFESLIFVISDIHYFWQE